MISTSEKNILVQMALTAQKNAYAPYSHFQVGAALLDDRGKLFSGCNVENASYGATNCAERTAIFTAVADGARKIRGLAVVTAENDFGKPCGICRQVIAEFAADDFVLLAVRPDGEFIELSMDELLPHYFGKDNLKA